MIYQVLLENGDEKFYKLSDKRIFSDCAPVVKGNPFYLSFRVLEVGKAD